MLWLTYSSTPLKWMLTDEFLLVPWYALEGNVVGIILFFSSNFPSNRVKKRLFVRSLMRPDSSTRALNGNLDFTTTIWVGLLCTCCCVLLFLRFYKEYDNLDYDGELPKGWFIIDLPFQWRFGVECIVLAKGLHCRLLVQLFLFADRSHALKCCKMQMKRGIMIRHSACYGLNFLNNSWIACSLLTVCNCQPAGTVRTFRSAIMQTHPNYVILWNKFQNFIYTSKPVLWRRWSGEKYLLWNVSILFFITSWYWIGHYWPYSRHCCKFGKKWSGTKCRLQRIRNIGVKVEVQEGVDEGFSDILHSAFKDVLER